MDDEYFTIYYVIDTIPNLPADHQLPIQDKRNVWIIDIYGEENITYQGAIDEINTTKLQKENPRSISVYE